MIDPIQSHQAGKVLCWYAIDETDREAVRQTMAHADMQMSELDGADLRNTRAVWVNLGWASLHGTDLRGADLRCANLVGADIRRARFDGAIMRGAVVDHQQAEQIGRHTDVSRCIVVHA